MWCERHPRSSSLKSILRSILRLDFLWRRSKDRNSRVMSRRMAFMLLNVYFHLSALFVQTARVMRGWGWDHWYEVGLLGLVPQVLGVALYFKNDYDRGDPFGTFRIIKWTWIHAYARIEERFTGRDLSKFHWENGLEHPDLMTNDRPTDPTGWVLCMGPDFRRRPLWYRNKVLREPDVVHGAHYRTRPLPRAGPTQDEGEWHRPLDLNRGEEVGPGGAAPATLRGPSRGTSMFSSLEDACGDPPIHWGEEAGRPTVLSFCSRT